MITLTIILVKKTGVNIKTNATIKVTIVVLVVVKYIK